MQAHPASLRLAAWLATALFFATAAFIVAHKVSDWPDAVVWAAVGVVFLIVGARPSRGLKSSPSGEGDHP